jgi:hypothetical protein
MFDHMSTSWATDEGLCMDGSDGTISDCLNSEGIEQAGGGGKGFFVLTNCKPVSAIRNLLVHNKNRNPEVSGDTHMLWLNNYVYNGSVNHLGIWHDSHGTGQPSLVTLIGNLGVNGPSTVPPFEYEILFHDSLPSGSQYYATDNVFPDGIVIDGGSGMVEVGSPPFALPSAMTTLASSAVKAYVMANAGARPLDRDPVDARIIDEVNNGTEAAPSPIDDEDDVGGYPTLAENTRVLSVPGNHADIRPSGYSVLEEDVIFPQTQAVQPV